MDETCPLCTGGGGRGFQRVRSDRRGRAAACALDNTQALPRSSLLQSGLSKVKMGLRELLSPPHLRRRLSGPPRAHTRSGTAAAARRSLPRRMVRRWGEGFSCCQQRECTVGTWVGATVGRGGGREERAGHGQRAQTADAQESGTGRSASDEYGVRDAACPMSTGCGTRRVRLVREFSTGRTVHRGRL
jgi:hypothetical protein